MNFIFPLILIFFAPAHAELQVIPTVTAEEIRAYVDVQAFQVELRLRRTPEDDQGKEANSEGLDIHEDPLACRNCRGATRILLKFLNRDYSQIQWIGVETENQTTSSLDGYLHSYIYSPDLNLIVDPTYRQFFVGLKDEEFKKLPRIFVATPEAFRAFMSDKLSEEDIETYLDTVWNRDLPKTHARDSEGKILYRTVGGSMRLDRWQPNSKEVSLMAGFLAKCRMMLSRRTGELLFPNKP